MIVQVAHPVPCRYRPRRARIDRYGVTAGLTPVTLREVAERPREALRLGATRVLAAEGTAWTVLRDGRENVTPSALAAFLADPRLDSMGTNSALGRWALCSPLLYHDAVSRGRVGDLDPTGAERFEGRERASADVTAFLDDRVRLHGDRVLVREERLVGLAELYRAAPRAKMGEHSRGDGTMFNRRPSIVAIRPDRLAALWDLHERRMKGPVPTGAWDGLAGIPAELRRDDDVAWIANRLPSTILWYARDLAKRRTENEPFAGLVRLIPALEALDRRGATHAIAGAELAPALETIREGLALATRAVEIADAGKDGPGDMQRTYRGLMRFLDAEYLPRLGRPPGHDNDEGALASLAPR